MPKRKREDGATPLRKSVRLERKSRQQPSNIAATQTSDVRKHKTAQSLPSLSTSGSAREDHCQIDARKSGSVTSLETSITQTQEHSFKPKPDKPERLVQNKERPRGDFTRSLLQIGNPTLEPSARRSSDGSELDVAKETQKIDPISYWATHNTWPPNFSEKQPMCPPDNTGKRQRTLSYSQSSQVQKPPSYFQSYKNGTVPEQYTSQYETHILTKGMDMDFLRGEKLVSGESKRSCTDLMKVTRHSIKPTIFPGKSFREIMNQLRVRNEAIVNRDITPMIIPPIASLHLSGNESFEHIVDEVNADWYSQNVLEGPRIRPDLAIGLFPSMFNAIEIKKLDHYKSVDNWTQFTANMYFPFLMLEVKCGRDSLDIADRQNMHSCSVAVRAILRITQEADKYREESKLKELSGRVLVFSISHDQRTVRLYGHYAIITEDKFTYYRYLIDTFEIFAKQDHLLVVHNFVQNVLESHIPEHVQRLRDALSVHPDPSTLSFDASSMSLNENYEQGLQYDQHGFKVPPIPGASSRRGSVITSTYDEKLLEQITKLGEQLEVETNRREEERKRHEEEKKRHEEETQKNRELLEQMRQDSKEREKRLERQIEEQRKQAEEQRKQAEEQRKQAEEQRKQAGEQMQQLLGMISRIQSKEATTH